MNRKTVGAVVVLLGLLIGGGFWWLESATRPDSGDSAGAPEVPVVRPVGGSGRTVVITPEAASGSMDSSSVGDSSSVAAASVDITPARQTVGDILAEPGDDFVKVAQKLSRLVVDPQVPMADREEALAHTLNLSAGNEAEVLTPLVKNPEVTDALADTILSEALNRPLSYQADLYLEALAVRKSPEMQKKIREHLAFLINGEDKGPNPADWAAAIKAAKAEWAP